MNNLVLVRPGTTRWIILGRLLGPTALIVGILLKVNQQPTGLPLIVAGIVFAILVEVYALIKNGKRRWVEDIGTGFKVLDARGVREFSDQQITALSLYEIQNRSEGMLKYVTRHFIVWTDADPAPIEMQNKILVGHKNPLDHLIARLLRAFEQRCEFEVQQGREVSGDGWSMSQTTLSIGKPPAASVIPIEMISAVGNYGNKLCIWKRDDEIAVAKFPLNTRNVHMLHVMLASRIQDVADESAPGESLGRILFEQRSQTVTKIMMWLLVVVTFLLGAGIAIGDSVQVGIVILLLGALILLSAIHVQKLVLRCQEYGVCRRGLYGERRMRYVDLQSFTFGLTRVYVNGVYTGTQLVLKFRPVLTSGAKAITYSKKIQAIDDDLEQLRDHISKVLAVRMGEELSRIGQVEWTSNLTICHQGILYKPAGFIGRKEATLLPWDRYNGFDLQKGMFHVFEAGKPKSVMQENVSQPNFFPGFHLLLSLFENDKERST